MITLKHFAILAICIWLLAIVVIAVRDMATIAACTDVGGSFDYERFLCDIDAGQASGSYMLARFPVFFGVTVALTVFFAMIWRFLSR